MKYRADIDGLRAIAVLSVIFFHAGIAGFAGGFVGVDVFFVISGYLITSLVHLDLEKNRFSIADFYERRIRRIFPVLLFMFAITVVAAYFIYLPGDLATLAKSLVPATLFSSNFWFAANTGYFDASADHHLLLHTWSLSVEEQFYIFFPVLLWALNRWRLRMAPTLILIFAASFALGLWATIYEPKFAFYHLPARTWELMVGALLAINLFPAVKARWAREFLGVTGLALIAASVFFFNKSLAFPGWRAMLPCFGAALLIYSGPQTFMARLLSLKPLVFTGLISFSLYLWHWPVLVFARYVQPQPLTTLQIAVLLAATFVISVLSWRCIETPFRHAAIFKVRKPLFAMAAASLTFFVAIGIVIQQSEGFPSRIPQSVTKLESAGGDHHPDRQKCHPDDRAFKISEMCVYGRKTPTIVVWGDSMAAEIAYVVGEMAGRRGKSVLHASQSSCPPVLRASVGVKEICVRQNRDLMAHLQRHPELSTVILVARYDIYPAEINDHIAEVVDTLTDQGRRVFVIHPIPQPNLYVPGQLALAEWHGRDFEHTYSTMETYIETHAKTIEALTATSAIPIKPADLICKSSSCRTELEGVPLYFDSSHLSVAGLRKLAPLFDPVFSAHVARRKVFPVKGRGPGA